jgi:hypothetical protein
MFISATGKRGHTVFILDVLVRLRSSSPRRPQLKSAMLRSGGFIWVVGSELEERRGAAPKGSDLMN